MTRAANLAEAAGSGFAFRNRIINGDMRIDQRNAGAAVTANPGSAYSCDRWKAYLNGPGTMTLAQSSVVPNNNFTNSVVATVTGTGSPSEASISQTIEGYNIADLGFGTSGASPITASFWVRSSVTGTFCFSLRQGSGSRSFVSPFTISSANTWQQVVISIPGDVAGTYNSTNGAGFIVQVCIGATSLITSTVNAWQAGNYVTTSAQTNLASTNGATFYITGVQLEKGSVATPFEFRPYGAELALCQRYYQYDSNNGGAYVHLLPACFVSATGAYALKIFPVEMRTLPSITFSAGSTFLSDGATSITPSSLACPGYSTNKTMRITVAFASGGVAGQGFVLAGAGSGTALITYSAEL